MLTCHWPNSNTGQHISALGSDANTPVQVVKGEWRVRDLVRRFKSLSGLLESF